MPLNLIRFEVRHLPAIMRFRRRRRLVELAGPMLGLVAFSAAVGAGVGLMMAPSSGRQLRHGMGERIGEMRERMVRMKNKTGDEAKQSAVNATPR